MSNGSGPWGGNNGNGGPKSSGPWGGGSSKGDGNSGPWGGGNGNNAGGSSDGGGRRGASPDSVSDMLERVRRRATNGGGGGGGGGNAGGQGGGGRGFEPFIKYWPLGLVAVVALWLASGIYTVEASDRAVVTTFGRVTSVANPGLHWRFPSPIQAHEPVPVLVPQETTIGVARGSDINPRTGRPIVRDRSASLMLTSDINIVDVELNIRWLISDPVAYRYSAANPRKIVDVAGEAALRSIIGRTGLEDVLAQGKDLVQSEIKRELQETLNSYGRREESAPIGLGIEIDNVLLVNAQPPAQVEEAFDDVQNARQDQQRSINEAQRERNEKLPAAKAKAFELEQAAEAYKVEQESLAIGERDRFLSVLSAYRNNPEVTVQRLYIETMERILAQRGAVVLDGNLGDSALPLVNLPTTASAN